MSESSFDAPRLVDSTLLGAFPVGQEGTPRRLAAQVGATEEVGKGARAQVGLLARAQVWTIVTIKPACSPSTQASEHCPERPWSSPMYGRTSLSKDSHKLPRPVSSLSPTWR